jgi:outer membrane protein assembly factor BamD
MVRIHIIIPVLMAAALFVSCSEYEKLLKSDDYQLQHDRAMEYYAAGDYVRAATLIERILPIYRGTQRAAEMSFILADSYYHRGDYILAAHHFDSFIRDYPNHERVEEAFYMRAYCNYLLSPRPSLDQSITRRSIDQFTLFLTRFPNSERVGEAQKLIAEMREKLIEKSFHSARLYFDMGDYQAAVIAFKNSLNEFPGSRYREEKMFLILKSSFLLAERSVPERQIQRFQATLEEYYAFIEEYPESTFRSEANSFLNRALSVVDEDPIDELTLEYIK